MKSDDLASNLEFWSGRARPNGAAEELRRRGRLPGRPSIPRLLRRGAELAPSGRARAPLADPAVAPVTTAPARGTPATAATPTTAAVPRTPGCRGLTPARPEVRCVVDGVDLDVQLVATNEATAAYERATGVHPVPG